ncbi:hypothetical protein HKX48_008097 [Thoreauomyces humboldtii]|nr:hypothetical protein HKX48_008097 [Thoreauomyces humboldtii]
MPVFDRGSYYELRHNRDLARGAWAAERAARLRVERHAETVRRTRQLEAETRMNLATASAIRARRLKIEALAAPAAHCPADPKGVPAGVLGLARRQAEARRFGSTPGTPSDPMSAGPMTLMKALGADLVAMKSALVSPRDPGVELRAKGSDSAMTRTTASEPAPPNITLAIVPADVTLAMLMLARALTASTKLVAVRVCMRNIEPALNGYTRDQRKKKERASAF